MNGREPRSPEICVYGERREGTLREGGGICVAGHDLIVGDTVRVGGRSRTVTEIRRVVTERIALTVIVASRSLPGR